MYISNFSIIGQSPNYGKYKNINKYDENVSVSYLLYRNNPINLLDMYQPNSITDISSITDAYSQNPQFINLAKYTYDQTDNPNGVIKQDAETNSLAINENNFSSSDVKRIFYISKNKTLTENTFNGSVTPMIILHPLDYYFYKNNRYSIDLEIGTKPDHFSYTTISNEANLIGNVKEEIINKIETDTLDSVYILFKDLTLPTDKIQSLKSIYLVCDNPDKYIFKLDEEDKRIYSNNHKYLYYTDINKNTTFTFKVLNNTDNSVVQQVTITAG